MLRGGGGGYDRACFRRLLETHLLVVAVGLMQPQSRGSVRLRSARFSVPPVVDPHYLEEEEDLERLPVCSAHCVALLF